uniref:Uncharacterized protein n=1 Tax=Chromera velia CCMP2878 TaxID=1169474 RepID=A0A0G4FXU9_9ALVE|eukprot:Cvel_3888.t1-p1 / transcript=Cvel_3888.t1 / gene=Cvel_3888 / organism=Chromera_velia_CCMP2878 / gene_product=hypothetical protein / transcript_product=hypothetical protein / location=Cvel_scaffold164:110228-111393(+) / protein_length=332 / sequence_SO=supercontig / SO=protein_coding / is_pseudo=false
MTEFTDRKKGVSFMKFGCNGDLPSSSYSSSSSFFSGALLHQSRTGTQRKGRAGSLSSSGSVSASLFSPQQSSHCSHSVMNLVEGFQLNAEPGGGGQGGLMTAEGGGGEEGLGGPRVTAWTDPFYAAPIFEEEPEKGPLLVKGSKNGKGSTNSTLFGEFADMSFLQFENGAYMLTQADCVPLVVSHQVERRQMSISVFVHLTDLPVGERRVLLDNGKGFQLGFVGKEGGRMDFGVLDPERVEDDVVAETCFGAPSLFTISLAEGNAEGGGEEGAVAFRLWKMGAELSAHRGDETVAQARRGGVRGSQKGAERLLGLGPLAVGCDVKGENCLNG